MSHCSMQCRVEVVPNVTGERRHHRVLIEVNQADQARLLAPEHIRVVLGAEEARYHAARRVHSLVLAPPVAEQHVEKVGCAQDAQR